MAERGLSLEALSALVHVAADGVVVVGVDGTHLLVNRAFCEMTGFSAEELLGTTVPHPYWAPEAIPEIVNAWRETSTGQPDRYELRFLRKNGERFTASVHPAFGQIGEQALLIASVRDLTREQEVESQLSEAHHLIDALCSGGYLAWWAWDLEQDATRTSDSFFEQLGYRPGEFGATYEEMATRLHPDDIGRADEKIQGLISGAIPFYESEHRVRRADGGWSWVQARGFIMERSSDGQPRLIMGTRQIIDRRMERELRLQELDRVRVVAQTAAGVAHDFNNLLTVMQSNLELLSLDVDLSASEAAEEMRRAVSRGAELTRALLEYSRPPSSDRQVIDVVEALRSLHQLVSSVVADRAEIRWHLPEHSIEVEAQVSDIERCVVNLVANARDALAGSGGTIQISVSEERIEEEAATLGLRPGRYTVVSVVDDGPGMSSEVRERCLEPLFTTKARSEGTGLGLSVVSRILNGAGGALDVCSDEGKGTTVRLVLPAVQGGDSTVLSSPRVSAPPLEEEFRGSERLLVVDDEPSVARALAGTLGDLGYRVSWVDNPRSALLLLECEEIDLLLTDINMPFTIDGVELARRSVERRPDLKVLFISALPEDHHVQDLRQLGELVEKPFTLQELARSIRSALPC